MKVAVLGAGAWGTALSKILIEGGHEVALWARHPERVATLATTGINERYLPGVRVPAIKQIEADILRAARDCNCVVVAVPSKAFREVTKALGDFRGVVVSVTKGIEYDTGLTMCGVLAQSVPGAKRVAFSGPTLALEVGRGIPTAIVAASDDPDAAQAIQHRPSASTPAQTRWVSNWAAP